MLRPDRAVPPSLAAAVTLAVLAAAVMPAVLARPAVAADARAALEAELRLERRLLARDVAAHTEARAAERAALARAEEAAGRLDDLVRSASPTLAAFERLQAEVAAARDASRAAGARAEELARRIGERLRRIGAVGEELGGAARVPDPLSGRWQVRVLPQNASGVFELQLDGTLVSGKYRLDNGPAGSLRGTFVDNAVRLERIDARTGFDSTFLGAIDGAGRINGTWHATELAQGEPASGQWSAVRVTAQ